MKLFTHYISLTVLAVFCFSVCQSQQNNYVGKYRYIDIKFHAGNHLYTGDSLQNALDGGYRALEIRYAWQTTQHNSWAQAYYYPSYGIGFYTGYVGDPQILGKPRALYGFVNFTFSKQKRFTFNADLATGVSFHFKPYDPIKNSSNDAIGSKRNIYFNLGLGGNIILNRELDLTYGVDITHFSNGRVYTPNHGLNMAGFNLGARYHFNFSQKKLDKSYQPSKILRSRPELDNYRKPKCLNQNNLLVYQAIGTVQNSIDEATSTRYITSSTVIEYQHKFSEMHALSAGVDGFYDASLADTITNPQYLIYGTMFFCAYHAGYDFMFWKLSVRMQVGGYFSEAGKKYKSNYFMRPAIKYDFNKKVYAQIGLKTYDGAKADWAEFGLGVILFGK